MKTLLLVLALASVSVAASADTRCGWILNPTPGNTALIDGDGDWVVSVQGGYQAQGVLNANVSTDQFIEVNGNYGYYCGCISGKFDNKAKLVKRIDSDSVKPLKACLMDSKIPSIK